MTNQNVSGFFAFRWMISTLLIKVLFVIGLVVCVARAFEHEAGGVFFWLYLITGPLILRLLCEAAIVVFRIHDTLLEVRAREEQVHDALLEIRRNTEE